jgi:hypothetical protein
VLRQLFLLNSGHHPEMAPHLAKAQVALITGMLSSGLLLILRSQQQLTVVLAACEGYAQTFDMMAPLKPLETAEGESEASHLLC